MISLDVSPQEDEPGAEAVVHAGELLEFLVRRIGDFALPLITYADIKRVAVSDTSGNHESLDLSVLSTREGGTGKELSTYHIESRSVCAHICNIVGIALT